MQAAVMAAGVIGALVCTALGVPLLIIGLRNRSARRSQGPIGYPPGYLPGYPAGYPPAFPGYPGGGYAPVPQPPRKSGTGLIVTGVVLLALSALGVVGTVALAAGRSSRLAVGDCFTNEILDKQRWKSKSCSSPEAVLEYAATADAGGNCPDGKLDSSSYLSVEHDGSRRCFIPNLLVSHCYSSDHNGETIRAVSCGAGGTVVRITTRLDNTVDTSACPSGARTVTFPQPRRTYCSERVAGII
ncbi:hypothetical protein C0J29_09305 [Mycobacterium paragordonae]|uniref:Uncharacterized protein n=1 Tax=Mycobacterium paragordonae TaxID=1389713 RepID=A0A386U398_9MYCO|nr:MULTISPECIES: hypothetical protein [Mycobacterium]AYE94952.1 hypothetical protein C0J29_09305 [Mycobacterium paragordonae]MDP7736103.1 hypothetical protein [Mycobacterium paragordonae]OBJ90238.1 hypothetical protein A9W97_13480 [Mycobacterium gordonae]TDK99685.1 hypothetical protein EUA02_06975 [Mycobacterium paragordonae]TDL01922.1 hypothetical protein EI067_02600 [Mycobacterium paragordonae]